MANSPEQEKENREQVLSMMRYQIQELRESLDYYRKKSQKLEKSLVALRTRIREALDESS
jgi:septal ring factor EnvC (AmiA/AmiB activator)